MIDDPLKFILIIFIAGEYYNLNFILIRGKILTNEAIVDLRDKIDPDLHLINQCRNVWLIIYLQH